jgi:hypothetical protein
MTTFRESHADLLDAQIAILATIGRDGVPQSATVRCGLREHDAPGGERAVVTLEPANVYAVDMSG